MKKIKFLFPLSILSLLLLAGCVDSGASSNTDGGNTNPVEIDDDTVSTSFSLTDESGNAVSSSNGIYTISAAGTYIAAGKLSNGQIYVDASDAEVELDLQGVSITNSTKSPIFVNDCADFILKAKKDTTNYIYDTRTTDYSSSDTEGRGAVHVENGDLKVNGQGTLSVISYANSGLHGKDNVTVKNLTMLIKAVNNGIRGNDKVTIEESPTLGIVAGNNGIVTHNSDVGTNAQHGYIYITGGTITINSYGDGIDAAYGVEISTGTDSDGNSYTPVIDIYTNKYSSYSVSSVTSGSNRRPGGGGQSGPGGGFDGGGMSGGTSAEKADDSAKAIKAVESINISAGTIYSYTYDDCIHTNADALDTGKTGSAAINISGGSIDLKASDDAIHADGTLTISGGEINVIQSHEGIEANIINIKGGKTYVVGDDDGVNASSQINISGGYLDVTVNPNNDTDGIDSNGTYTQTGGIVIARGPNSSMAAALDTDGTASITSGTIIVLGALGERGLTRGSSVSTYSLSLHSSGSHTVTIDGVSYTFKNSYTYGKTICYSSVKVS